MQHLLLYTCSRAWTLSIFSSSDSELWSCAELYMHMYMHQVYNESTKHQYYLEMLMLTMYYYLVYMCLDPYV